jgi:hypothetical protein
MRSPTGPLWYRGPKSLRDAIGYAKFNSRLHDVLIRVYDESGNVIETKPLTAKPCDAANSWEESWLTRPKPLKHG